MSEPTVRTLSGTFNATVAGATGVGASSGTFVASSQAPADVRAAAGYVCTGVNDDVEIKAAIAAAGVEVSDPTNPASASGAGKVVLSAGRFNIGSSLPLETGVWLQGQGFLTELCAQGLGGTGVVTLADTSVHLARVTDLWVNGNGDTGDAHGIHFIGQGSTYSERPDSNPDAYNYIQNVLVTDTSNTSGELRHGIWLAGSSGGSRASKIISTHCHRIYGHGVYLNGSSDCHLTDVTASTEHDDGVGFYVASGNSNLTNCKAFYTEAQGYLVTSGRTMLIGCVAQDCGTWGFDIDGSGDPSMIGCQADSNGRNDNVDGGGVRTNSSMLMHGVSMFDRNQTPSSPQLKGLEIVGDHTKMYLTGRIELPSGTDHVVNAGGLDDSSNVVQLVRSGTTPLIKP